MRKRANLTGTDLRHWRESHQMTAAKAADALGVGRSVYTEWENGRRYIPLTIERLLPLLKKRKKP